jgi:hypothetical protein
MPEYGGKKKARGILRYDYMKDGSEPSRLAGMETRANAKLEIRAKLDLVILNAVKNLVLQHPNSPFLCAGVSYKKEATSR